MIQFYWVHDFKISRHFNSINVVNIFLCKIQSMLGSIEILCLPLILLETPKEYYGNVKNAADSTDVHIIQFLSGNRNISLRKSIRCALFLTFPALLSCFANNSAFFDLQNPNLVIL